jgi:hypothetical protein
MIVAVRAAPVLLAFVILGCGGSSNGGSSVPTTKPDQGTLKPLTPKRVEKQIAEIQQRSGIAVKSVHCPRNVVIRKGRRFKCVTEQKDGDPITTTVTPTNVRLGLAKFLFTLPG